MSINPLVLLEKAVNEHGSSVILKERLALVKEMLSKVEREKEELQKQLTDARAEIGKLKAQVPGTEFVLYGGVKFRRKPSGGFERTVYCPKCEVGMATLRGGRPFACGRCSSLSGFNSGQLNAIIRELESEYD